jgi:DNA-binding IclR family transcriptional regulator
MASTYQAPAVQRSIRLLEHLAQCPEPRNLSQLARSLGYSKSTLHGILHALEDAQWIEREDLGAGYGPGRGLLALARKAFGVWELPHLAEPLMQRINERVGETVFLGARKGERVRILSRVEGKGLLRVTSPPGTTLPLLAAATAKVFLADLPLEQAKAILGEGPLPAFTDRSILDPEAFMAEVARARQRGYACDEEEYLRGIRAVAAPIRHQGRTVAALWVVGFVSSFTQDVREDAIEELTSATALLSRLLDIRGSRLSLP